MSITMIATSLFRRSARDSSRDRCTNIDRRFGSPVSGSVSESSWVCSNTIELWMTAPACSADPLEQPAVILGVVVRLDVIERQAADERVVELQRADNRRTGSRSPCSGRRLRS